MAETLEELKPILKSQIVECLNLDNLIAQELDYDTPLFGDHTGLDSIDALELVVLLDKKYSIKLTDSKVARKIFVNIRSIAEFVHSNRKR